MRKVFILTIAIVLIGMQNGLAQWTEDLNNNLYSSNNGVGIGKTNPSTFIGKFEVHQLTTNNTSWSSYIYNSSSSGKGLLVKSGYASTNPILQLEDKYGSIKFKVTSIGNVGIGQITGNPSSMLHIYGGNPDLILGFNASPSDNLSEIRFDNNGVNMAKIYYDKTNNELSFKSTGNINIADYDDNYNGTMIFWSQNTHLATFGKKDTNAPQLGFFGENGVINLRTGYSTAAGFPETGDFTFGTHYVHNALRIKNATGDVCINTTTAHTLTSGGNAKLSVNGGIAAKEIEVTINGWSDFVFDNDFNLMPLYELENYINTNKHLPDVPSEADVLENGVNLGNMDAVLLQKIEELTLYTIEQQKMIDALKKEVDELKNK